MVRLNSKFGPINLIQVYAPAAYNRDEFGDVYKQLQLALGTTKHHEITEILGDFKAKVRAKVELHVGQHGIGE